MLREVLSHSKGQYLFVEQMNVCVREEEVGGAANSLVFLKNKGEKEMILERNKWQA